ncbi:MAG TPA: CDP-glycerol glycerophosphotransferase family protein [Galbitalea sp.]|nr:CDP-glycerol glycerophosphotransferase family protein [Galbitalea sp.]
MSALGTAVGIILGRVRGRRLARTIAARKPTNTPVAVYFADAPSSLYQLRRWYRSLEALNRIYPTVIITSDASTYELVRRETTIDVTYAYGVPELTRVLDAQAVKLVLYPNHSAENFRVLRFPVPVHIFIGHGESAKDSSVSRQLKAYDFTFVADKNSIEQLRQIRGYDADAAAVVIGSPWLGFLGAPPASWTGDGRTVILYAPTWEGDRPSMDYSSVETLGESIVDAILANPKLRLIYRPHPWLGRARPASAAADARIRRTIAASNRGDVVDTGDYGWALAVADCCVTDVSSVVFDARALGKPVLVTDSASASNIGGLLKTLVAAGKPGINPQATSMDGFLAAVGDALRLTGTGTS